MKDIIHILYTSEHIIAWGLTTLFAVSSMIIYLILSALKRENIFTDHKIIFLTLSVFLFDLSTMPLLLLTKNYDIKRYFEFAGTMLLFINVYFWFRFIIVFLTSIKHDK